MNKSSNLKKNKNKKTKKVKILNKKKKKKKKKKEKKIPNFSKKKKIINQNFQFLQTFKISKPPSAFFEAWNMSQSKGIRQVCRILFNE